MILTSLRLFLELVPKGNLYVQITFYLHYKLLRFSEINVGGIEILNKFNLNHLSTDSIKSVFVEFSAFLMISLERLTEEYILILLVTISCTFFPV